MLVYYIMIIFFVVLITSSSTSIGFVFTPVVLFNVSFVNTSTRSRASEAYYTGDEDKRR